MLTTHDLIRLPCPPELIDAGVRVACQWLTGAPRHLGNDPHHLLRRKISQVAVELALRRLLAERAIPSKTLGAEPFTDPNQRDLSLAGHRCHLITTLLSQRAQIRAVRAEPAEFMKAAALIPQDQFVREGQTSGDLYLFAFLLGLAAKSRDDLAKVKKANLPHYYLSLLPRNWSQPGEWAPLRSGSILSESREPVTLELGGQAEDRSHLIQQMQLPPQAATPIPEGFHGLTYLHSLEHPGASLELDMEGAKPQRIQASQWGNVWVYGMEICLAGWMTQAEYRQKSQPLPAGQPTWQFTQTRAKNLSLPLGDLHPLEGLFEQVRAWGSS